MGACMLLFFSALSYATPEQELRQGMWALNGWALGNMLSSTPSTLYTQDRYTQSFHQMNLTWNVVNAGLASYSLLQNQPVEPQKMAKIFWINAGLDVLYIAGGLILRSQGIKQQNEQWIGWGDSIMIQGSFLFVFDGIMGWRMQKLQKKFPFPN